MTGEKRIGCWTSELGTAVEEADKGRGLVGRGCGRGKYNTMKELRRKGAVNRERGAVRGRRTTMSALFPSVPNNRRAGFTSRRVFLCVFHSLRQHVGCLGALRGLRGAILPGSSSMAVALCLARTSNTPMSTQVNRTCACRKPWDGDSYCKSRPQYRHTIASSRINSAQ
jgi:hypothetical protein